MNTAELIYQSSQELSESERLEVFGYINMIKARFGRKKSVPETILPQSQQTKNIDKSEQIYQLMCEISDDFQKSGRTIDMDDFEKSRQDRDLDR